MEEYNEIIDTIRNKYEKEVFISEYKRTQNLDETLLHMYGKFKKYEYLLKIRSDIMKLEASKLMINENSEICFMLICSIYDDNIKIQALDGINHGDILCKVIQSIKEDNLKEILLRRYKNKLLVKDNDGFEEEIFLCDVIRSFKDDNIRCRIMHEMIDDLGRVYCSELAMIINEIADEKRRLEEMYNLCKINGTFWEYASNSVISTLSLDEDKIKEMHKLMSFTPNDEEFFAYNPEKCWKGIDNVIASLSTDVLKLNCIEEMKDKIEIFGKIIATLSSDELKLEQTRKYKNVFSWIFDFPIIIESIKDEKIKEILANEWTINEFNRTGQIEQMSRGLRRKIGEQDQFIIKQGEIIIPYKLLLDDDDDNNLDFKFINNELPVKVMDDLFECEHEEVRDFLKFAKALGCFSKEKMLDESGRETEIFLGQKASSLLVQLMKTEELKLRKIS